LQDGGNERASATQACLVEDRRQMVLHARCRHLEPASSRLKGGDDDVVRWVISSNGVHCGATTSSLPRATNGVPVAATVEARVWSANRSVVASRLREVASNARSTRLKARVPGAEARPGDACLEGAAGSAAMPLADCACLLRSHSRCLDPAAVRTRMSSGPVRIWALAEVRGLVSKLSASTERHLARRTTQRFPRRRRGVRITSCPR